MTYLIKIAFLLCRSLNICVIEKKRKNLSEKTNSDCGIVKMLFLLNTSYFFSGKKKKYLDNFADN